MNYLKFLKKLKRYLLSIILGIEEEDPRPKISILIPFSSTNPIRKKTFRWLLKYWSHELPDAEVIIGHSHGEIFCKGEALNNAFKKSRGRVIAIIDADAYIEGRIVEKCADRILEEIDNHLWYVPYRHLYRLDREITEEIIESSPANPLRLECPPPHEDLDDNGHKSRYGHRYGAMAMIFPREALEVLGCFDERFKGWGAEDVALLRALDTLWGKHKTMNECIFHLWHPFIGADYKTRKWEGQERSNPNEKLANEYNKATRSPSKMRELVDAGCSECKDCYKKPKKK